MREKIPLEKFTVVITEDPPKKKAKASPAQKETKPRSPKSDTTPPHSN